MDQHQEYEAGQEPDKPQKSRLRTALGRTVEAVISSAFALHLTLYSVPDLTSSSLEDYMEDRDIPIELVDGVDISNIRVYDSNNLFAAIDNAAREYISPVEDDGEWLDDYADGFNRVWKDRATAIHSGGEGRIILYPEMSLDEFKEFLEYHTGIPAEDIEVTDDINKMAFLYALRHEVEHIHDATHEREPSVSTQRDSTAFSSIRQLLFAEISEDEKTLKGEFDADYGSVKALKKALNIDASEYVVSWRAAAMLGGKRTHDTEFYLQSKLDDPSTGVEVAGHEVDRSALITAVSTKRSEYPEDLLGKYKTYMSVLDVIDDINAGHYVGPENEFANSDLLPDELRQALQEDYCDPQTSERLKRMAELYVSGFEYLAPTKAEELRTLRESLKADNNPRLENF